MIYTDNAFIKVEIFGMFCPIFLTADDHKMQTDNTKESQSSLVKEGQFPWSSTWGRPWGSVVLFSSSSVSYMTPGTVLWPLGRAAFAALYDYLALGRSNISSTYM